MIKLLTAYTTEIDEIEVALDEIFEQLDLDELLTNSVGIVYTYYDFIESGVIAALAERLPFEIVGMTTMASQSGDDQGMYRLGLSVLTSDDVRFSTAVTNPLTADNNASEIAASYKDARAKLNADPKFIIAFLPYLKDISCADLLYSMDKEVDGLPIWGSMSSDMDMSYVHCRTFKDATVEQWSISMVLVEGAVEPEFIVENIPEKSIRDSRSVITDSEDCLIRAVDGVPFTKYLDEVGIVMNADSSTLIPFLIDYRDGSRRVALGVYTINEDGSVIMGGRVPTGSTIAVGEIDYNSITETAKIGTQQAIETGKSGGMLMLPCVTRYIMLAPNQEDEMKLVEENINGNIPYSLAYSGGEVCPIKASDGKLYNRFHNYTFSACIF
jgi:hypothetical protein